MIINILYHVCQTLQKLTHPQIFELKLINILMLTTWICYKTLLINHIIQ